MEEHRGSTNAPAPQHDISMEMDFGGAEGEPDRDTNEQPEVSQQDAAFTHALCDVVFNP